MRDRAPLRLPTENPGQDLAGPFATIVERKIPHIYVRRDVPDRPGDDLADLVCRQAPLEGVRGDDDPCHPGEAQGSSCA